YNGDLLYEPWEIYDERGYAFTTFEAYRDKCLHMQMEPVSHLPPRRSVPAAGTIVMCSVEELGLEDEAEKSSNSLVGRGWSPGWGNADKALAEFIQGSKFEPEGEYVRCWLPELTRMPAEWIHHTGDAPITALIVAVVELGVNYPKPIIDIDFCYRASSESYIQDVGNGSSRKSFKFKWNS
ncbi:hypothetical protein NC652_021778, partial [Populus alba x Populus x berolinensis]